MKVTYHSYFFEDENGQHLNSVVNLLKKFIKHGNNKLKADFISASGDNLFLFKESNTLYSLIITKDNELIKKINSENVTYEDIRNDLDDNESIGFASFVHIDTDHYAIASTVQGPKNKSFVEFMNQLLEKLRLNISFYSIPFPSKISREDVLTFDHIGKTVFEVEPSSNAGKKLLRSLGIKPSPNEFNGLEIRIKPNRGTDIKKHIPGINEKFDDESIKKYIVSAKEHMEDSLTDFYITGNGFVCDYIKGDGLIGKKISEAKSKNEVLKIKLQELRADKRYSHDNIKSLNHFNHDNAWIDHISNYYQD